MGNPVILMQLVTVGFMWGGGSREIYRGSLEQTSKLKAPPRPLLWYAMIIKKKERD